MPRAWMVRPTQPTRYGVGLIVLIVLATAAFLVVRYPALPWLLPVHFRTGGAPNGWQYKTLARVLIPLFVQLALAVSLVAIAALLLSRTRAGHESARTRCPGRRGGGRGGRSHRAHLGGLPGLRGGCPGQHVDVRAVRTRAVRISFSKLPAFS